MQANERLDTVDTDALSFVAREFMDAWSRAVEATPRASGATVPTGLIFQGFGLTLNPTGPTDAKVRVQSAVGVAFDANGRMIIKESGVQVDLTLPSGNSQVYVYYVESASDTTVRRSIAVSSPFVESPQSIATKFKGDAAFFTRVGDQTSIVASDVVNGATTPLCFLGVANNSGGTVTMTGYNASTAPNGAFATNRLTSVTLPATLPTTSTANGSVATMQGLIAAALYVVGQAVWRGSRNFTPSAANNFGAFNLPAVGIDALFDSSAEATTTPITAWRDWNLNRRSLIDHNGYRMGRVTERDEDWDTASTYTVGSSVYASQRVGGSGGGFGLGTDPEALLITATGQVFAIGVPSKLRSSVSLTSCVVDVFRNAGGDVINLSLEYFDNATLAWTLLQSLTSNSGTGAVAASLAAPTAHAGSPVSTPPGSALRVKAVGTTITANFHIRRVTIGVVEDPTGWVFTAPNVVSADFSTAIAVCRRTYADPIAGLNQRTVVLTTTIFGVAMNGASFGVGTHTTEAYECFLDANCCYVQEWTMRTGTITAASNNRNFALGVQSSNAGAENRFIYFHNQNTTTNWQLRVVGSSTADTDTGVAIGANTVYRMRLEIVGENVSTAGAGAFRVRAFVNGALVANVATTTFPTADVIRPYFHNGLTTNVGAAFEFRVGKLRRVWNHMLNGDNL